MRDLFKAELAKNNPQDKLALAKKLTDQANETADDPVARLVGTNCHGCHLTLSSMALDKIRRLPPDALALCDECGRILIH